jgi:methylphosphotriester-DNA--protein-cysteine methyltransferase
MKPWNHRYVAVGGKIAEQCGYADEYYFNRHFHRKVGMPPAKFRMSALNGGGQIFGTGAA